MTSNQDRKTLRILLVEDDRVDAKAVTRALGAMDPLYEVDTATSLASARLKLGEASYEAAILDHELPDGRGFDLLPDLGNIPTILLTGAGSMRLAAMALRLRVSDYLVKDPSNLWLKKLPDVLKTVIARKSEEVHDLQMLSDLLADIVNRASEALAELPEDSRARGRVACVARAGEQAVEVCRQMLARQGTRSVPPPHLTRDP